MLRADTGRPYGDGNVRKRIGPAEQIASDDVCGTSGRPSPTLYDETRCAFSGTSRTPSPTAVELVPSKIDGGGKPPPYESACGSDDSL